MESIASVPGPLLAMYSIATGATGKAFTKQIAIILVVSIFYADPGVQRCRSYKLDRPCNIRGRKHSRRYRHGARTSASRQVAPGTFRVLVSVVVLAAALQMIWKSGVL